MSAALTAFFAKRLSVRVAAGLAAGWAYVESARQERDAALAKVVAHGHRSASLLHFVPARDLIWLSARILEAEGLSTQPLEPVVTGFLGSFRTVLGVHLRWLESRLAVAIEMNIEGDDQLLLPMLVALPAHPSLVHPDSEAALSLLRQVLPQVESVPEYQFLLHPLRLAPHHVPTPNIQNPLPAGPGCLCAFSLIAGLILVPLGETNPILYIGEPILITLFGWSVYRVHKLEPQRRRWLEQKRQLPTRRQAVEAARKKESERLQTVAARLWQMDTWLNAQSEQAIRSSFTP